MSQFYSIDSARVSLREYWWSAKSPLVLIAWILKWLRVRIPSSSDDPNVDSVLPFQVEVLPPDIEARFQPLTTELTALGFCDPIHHVIYDPGTRTTIYWRTFRHTSGKSFGRIHHRIWQQAQKPQRGLFPMFFTGFTDGTFLVSSAGKPDMAAPGTVRMQRMRGASASVLWAAHNRTADIMSQRKAVSNFLNQADLVQVCERHHILMRDFHLNRGVFRVRTEAEQVQTESFTTRVAEAQAGGLENPEVLAELERLQEQKPGWQSAIWILAATLLGFIAAGAAKWDLKFTLWIIPILLFHEAGHWVAMRLFHYRNLRMFFIPFFGAAVTGRNWNVAGWKKALVSLAGPVPGIALGIVLGLFGLVLHHSKLVEGALLLLFVNGFNLLPILPLDGGHVLQDLLFCRNRWLDGAFRILAIIGLIALGIFAGMKLLMYVAIPLAMALPVVFKLSKVTDDLRKQALPEPSPGEDRIPVATAQVIIGAVRQVFSKKVSLGHKALAQNTLTVFERLNAKPPGVLATIALLGVHGCALVTSLVIGVLLIVGQNRGDFLAALTRRAQHDYQPGDIQHWPEGFVPSSPTDIRHILVTSLNSRAGAIQAFSALTNQVPPDSRLTRFGDALLLSLPAADDAARERWFELFQARSTNVFVALSNSPIAVSLSFLARDKSSATNLELELNQYFENTMSMRLVAPWSPDARKPEFVAWRRCRRDWMRIGEAQNQAARDPSLANFTARIIVAARRGSVAEQERLAREQTASLKLLQAQALQRLQSDPENPVDPELITLNAQLNDESLTNAIERKAILQRIANKLGKIDYPPDDPFGVNGGFVLRHGLVLQIPSAGFYDVFQGMPALGAWLIAQNCRGIKYSFDGPGWLGPSLESEQ